MVRGRPSTDTTTSGESPKPRVMFCQRQPLGSDTIHVQLVVDPPRGSSSPPVPETRIALPSSVFVDSTQFNGARDVARTPFAVGHRIDSTVIGAGESFRTTTATRQ